MPSTGYMTGSIGRYDSYSVQRDFEKAQRDATLNWRNSDAARNLINNQWAYEKIGMTPAAAAAASKDNTEALMTALHARTETEVASGEALNHILAAIVAAEAKGGKGVSAFLPPQVLGEVRFAGKTGEVLNLLRQAGHLPFPAAFETPESGRCVTRSSTATSPPWPRRCFSASRMKPASSRYWKPISRRPNSHRPSSSGSSHSRTRSRPDVSSINWPD